MAEVERWREVAAGPVRGRPVIMAGSVAAAWTQAVPALREQGAGPFLVVAAEDGVGPLPEGDDVDRLAVELPEGDGGMMAEFRVWEAFVDAVPASVEAALDRFDPDRTAAVLVPGPVSLTHLGSRPVTGARRPEWTALEDKTLGDALFERAGVTVAPWWVGPPAEAPTAKHDTVWSGDSSGGWNGGASSVRWVRAGEDWSAWFAERHALVRVAPFLDGVPCSIHGFVAADGVAVFGPAEMVVLRSPERGLVYCGASTCWRPDAELVGEMGDAVRRVGALLAAEVGFRGAFTIDGVAAVDGFRPTELNPRWGAALRQGPDVHLLGLHRAVIEDPSVELGVDALGEAVRAWQDANPSGGAWTFLDHPVPAHDRGLHPDGAGGWQLGDRDGAPFTLLSGPTSGGRGMVRCMPAPGTTEPGPHFAPKAAELFAAVDHLCGFGLGPLAPAPDVRR